MLLTVKVKLLPNSEQKQQLLATMEKFNEACDMVSEEAFARRCFNKFAIQAKLYQRIREEYRLSAQLVVRCISKVVESYQTEITNIRERNQRKAPDMPQRVEEVSRANVPRPSIIGYSS
jgi:predicted transposase